ncbi:MAG: polyketide cyclase/dehydrase [Planctomycetaceae bacterium]|nr:polyketide cyclase/dehydrase [Planctomycetaceae bacterium]
MSALTVDIDIKASPQRAFEVFTDLDNASQNVRGIEKMELLTEGPVGIGTRFRETRIMMGKEATEDMEITEFQPGELYAHEAQSHGCHYISTYRFDPAGEITRVSMAFEGRALSILSKIISGALGWMMTGMMRKCILEDLNDLKAVAEQAVEVSQE